ncbi:MAG: hypothetical protein WAM78_22135 [Candidatus Sulfotelmatobacter sp.]
MPTGAGVLEAIKIQFDALFVVTIVEVAEFVVAQGGRSALSAVDLDVLESWGWRDFANRSLGCNQLGAKY